MDQESSSPLPESSKEHRDRRVVPITLLAGFLGSGKTSTIQHVLSMADQQQQNWTVGVIVNDMAAVNIDAKLLQGYSSTFGSRDNDGERMLLPSDSGSQSSTSVTNWIELQNGCICCTIQDEWWNAIETLLLVSSSSSATAATIPARKPLDAIVVELSGVADPLALQEQFSSWRPKLPVDIGLQIVTVVDATTFGSDYYTWDLVQDRPQWTRNGNGGTRNDATDPNDYYYTTATTTTTDSRRKVAELLAEQVEAATGLVLVNKVDVATPTQTATARAMVRALNPHARVVSTAMGRSISDDDDDDDDDDGTTSWTTSLFWKKEQSREATNGTHDAVPGPESLDTHCHNPSTCTDPTHQHYESSHDAHAPNTMPNLGIASFVYRATRPFDMSRLRALLHQWPVPVQDTLELGQEAMVATNNPIDPSQNCSGGPWTGLLRSKGFCWTAPQVWSGVHSDAWRHDTAMYWSHAGRQMGISTAGKWWASIPNDKMQSYFADNRNEYDRIQREDFVSDEFGDRRQEIVFIGTNLNSHEISSALDDCLCTDREMEAYRQKLRNFMDSRGSSVTKSSGLFGVGSMNHTDMRE
jgi:G3E family GTPase